MINDYNEEEVKLMLDDCTNERRKHQLTKWDLSFLSTCYQMHDKGIMLSQKQLNTLDRIWERVTENG